MCRFKVDESASLYCQSSLCLSLSNRACIYINVLWAERVDRLRHADDEIIRFF